MNTEDVDQKEEAGKRKQPGWRQMSRAGEDWGVVWGLENLWHRCEQREEVQAVQTGRREKRKHKLTFREDRIWKQVARRAFHSG